MEMKRDLLREIYADVSKYDGKTVTVGIFEVISKDSATGGQITTQYTSTSGLVPVLVMLISALLMCVCGILIKKLKWKWVNDYALPICMILGMIMAIPLTSWLGGVIA